MFKSVNFQLRTSLSRRCQRKPIQALRNHVDIAAASVNSNNHPINLKTLTHQKSDFKNDEVLLRQVFDSPGFWKDFSQNSKVGYNYGLFQNRYLTKPQGFEEFASISLKKAQKIVSKVLNASSTTEYKDVVKNLDRLSDLLCRVIDVSDFVRATHPDPEMQNAAAQAFAMMYEYMNVLNTTKGLAEQLSIAILNSKISGTWDEEEMRVAKILKKDFEKSGIDHAQRERERFVSLSQEISQIGQKFVDQIAPKRKYLNFLSNKLTGMDPMLVKKYTSSGIVTLPSLGYIANSALQTIHDSEVRKEIFIASRSSTQESVETLQMLLLRRAELAKLSNFKSYAHMTLEDKMAHSPEVVNTFLQALSEKNNHLVHSEMKQLLDFKKLATKTTDTSLQPWDKEYYIFQKNYKARTKLKRADFLPSFFSLGRVMQGLSMLFSRLYGTRLVPRESLPGETWHPDVRRLDVISETDGHVAVLYCDLFSRPGKSNHPAHFTLRCSRLIRESEIEEAASMTNPLFENAIASVNDGMSTVTSPSGRVMQLPTIALICDFFPNTSDRPCLLSFSEFITLFHEMGHAIHSALGRTTFQNVSGTRCATDFAELPSVLMEYFATDPNVLGLFAEHYETGEKLDYAMVQEKLSIDGQFEGCETENQILLALLDQAYHSSLPLNPNFDSSKIYLDIQKKYGVMPIDVEGTSWQGLFGHLFCYGSMYYSYLFDRVLAKKLWKTIFQDGKASTGRDNGERFKEEILRWGGARDPWCCLSHLLQDERLKDGGEKAMSIVGSWGIQNRKN